MLAFFFPFCVPVFPFFFLVSTRCVLQTTDRVFFFLQAFFFLVHLRFEWCRSLIPILLKTLIFFLMLNVISVSFFSCFSECVFEIALIDLQLIGNIPPKKKKKNLLRCPLVEGCKVFFCPLVLPLDSVFPLNEQQSVLLCCVSSAKKLHSMLIACLYPQN